MADKPNNDVLMQFVESMNQSNQPYMVACVNSQVDMSRVNGIISKQVGVSASCSYDDAIMLLISMAESCANHYEVDSIDILGQCMVEIMSKRE